MNRTVLDLWAGLFVAIGIAAMVFLAMRVGNLTGNQMGETYTLMARFDNIGGLKKRGPVKSSGVMVGRINNINLNSNLFEAEVTLTMDSRYRFPRDTIASINTSGLLGEQYVSLEAGGDDIELLDGDIISNTQSAVVLEKLIGQFLFSGSQGGSSGK